MGIFQGNFFAGSIWSEKDTILIENENRKKKTPEIRTNYENCIFEYILNKTTIDIHKRIDWVRSAHKIYCFFAYLPIEQIREKIIKFFSIRGYSIEKYTLENHILTNEFEEKNAYCYYDIDFYANYFNVPLFFEEDCINTNKITYEDINLKKGETCIIKSGCGTQKTRQFFKAYKGETILYISYRCALAKDIKKNYGGVSYKKINPSRDECPDFLICQINSLYKFANWLDNFEYVFIDECEEIFSMLEFAISDNGDKNTSSIVKQSILTIMLKQIFLQKKVICASANITHKTFFALNNFGAKITKKINNTFLDKRGYSAFYYECPIEFSEKVYNFIFNNKKIIYASNSKKRIKELYIILSKKFPEKKILAIYNRDKEPIELQKKQEEILKDVDKNFILYDIVLYSPTIEAGVSFTKEYFDYIIGDFINSSNTYQSAYQMLFRCRYPKNKELHICINQITDKKEKEKENDKKDKKVKKVFISKEDSGEQYLQHRKNNKTFNNTNDKINFNDSFFRKIENFELLDPFNRTIILAQFFRIYSRKYFYRLLKNDLCSAGIKWNIIEKKEEPEEKKTPIKLSIDERNENQDIYNINDFCNGGHLYKRLKILDFKIDIDFVKNAYENKKIDPFNTFVAKIINYFTLKKNETFINDNEKASCMYKFIKFFEEKKNIKNSDLDNILYKFFEQKTETMNVAFQLKLTEQTKLKYLKKDEPTATRKINAINRLNAINQRLTWFLLKLTKQDNGYVKLETLNEEFLDNLKNNNFELELKKISSKLLSEDNI